MTCQYHGKLEEKLDEILRIAIKTESAFETVIPYIQQEQQALRKEIAKAKIQSAGLTSFLIAIGGAIAFFLK